MRDCLIVYAYIMLAVLFRKACFGTPGTVPLHRSLLRRKFAVVANRQLFTTLCPISPHPCLLTQKLIYVVAISPKKLF